MTAKKIATTLGTGTLGAGGAGAAAWNLGLFGGNGLEVNEVNGTDHQLNAVPPSPPGGSQVGTGQESTAGTPGNDGRDSQAHSGTNAGQGGGVSLRPMLSFSGATELDSMALNLNSEIIWSSTVSDRDEVAVAISTKGNGDGKLWRCEMKAVILVDHNAVDRSEFEHQGEELLGKIKANDDQRKKFVENCSKARIDSERADGGTSRIYLDTEKVERSGNKFKFRNQDLVDLLNRDFTGVYKLGDDEEEVLTSKEWDIKVVEKENKVTLSAKYNIIDYEKSISTPAVWNCSFSVKPNDIKGFSDESLKTILGTFGESGIMVEKKKYILRNCMKNNKDIKGLKFKEEGGSWRLEEESLKKITEGMYENPVGEKP